MDTDTFYRLRPTHMHGFITSPEVIERATPTPECMAQAQKFIQGWMAALHLPGSLIPAALVATTPYSLPQIGGLLLLPNGPEVEDALRRLLAALGRKHCQALNVGYWNNERRETSLFTARFDNITVAAAAETWRCHTADALRANIDVSCTMMPEGDNVLIIAGCPSQNPNYTREWRNHMGEISGEVKSSRSCTHDKTWQFDYLAL